MCMKSKSVLIESPGVSIPTHGVLRTPRLQLLLPDHWDETWLAGKSHKPAVNAISSVEDDLDSGGESYKYHTNPNEHSMNGPTARTEIN